MWIKQSKAWRSSADVTGCVCVCYLHAVAQTVQLLVVDWLAAVWWAWLHAGGREDLVAAWDSSHGCEHANLPPENLLLVHVHGLRAKVRG